MVPIVGIALQVFLATYLFRYSPQAMISAAGWIAVGLAVFYLYARKRDRAYAHVLAVREAAARREYRILVCVANPDTAGVVLRSSATLARIYGGELVALHVVEVADGDALTTGMARARATAAELDSRLAADASDVPFRVLVKVAHRTSYGIIETAIEEKCNLIVMGRSRRPTLLERLATTIVDHVVRSAPARVIIVSADRWPARIRTVLLPLEAGPHSEFTSQLAGEFARGTGARLRAVQVVPLAADATQLAQTWTELETLTKDRPPGSELRLVRADDIAESIIEHSADADVVFTGGTDAGLLEHLFAYPVPVEVAERARGAVVMCYEMANEPRGWLSTAR